MAGSYGNVDESSQNNNVIARMDERIYKIGNIIMFVFKVFLTM